MALGPRRREGLAGHMNLRDGADLIRRDREACLQVDLGRQRRLGASIFRFLKAHYGVQEVSLSANPQGVCALAMGASQGETWEALGSVKMSLLGKPGKIAVAAINGAAEKIG